MRKDTLGLDHFERLYADNPDPWHFASSPYERAKYAATLGALPRPSYARALEVGCSIGIFTDALAGRCADLLAIEPVGAALAEARRRNAHHAHLRFGALFVPRDWPDETFDLVVMSEVLDYLGAPDLMALAARLGGSLAPGGDLVLVHWVGKKGPVRRPDEATDLLMEAMGDGLVTLHAERNADYRLDVFRRC